MCLAVVSPGAEAQARPQVLSVRVWERVWEPVSASVRVAPAVAPAADHGAELARVAARAKTKSTEFWAPSPASATSAQAMVAPPLLASSSSKCLNCPEPRKTL